VSSAERFDHYQARCLYDPDRGFYVTGGSAGGARGDFLTSPEVGPLFGEVIAAALRAWWSDAGQPAQWRVVEVGAGRGSLAAAILRASPGVPIHYTCVERTSTLADLASQRLGDRVDVRATMPETADVVLANELLDNLPVRIVEATEAGWAELWVPESLRPTDLHLDTVEAATVAVGTRLPVLVEAADWVRRATRCAPRVLVFDYGVRRTVELVDREWLRTYIRHERGRDPFVTPGSADITVDIAVDQLPGPSVVATQAEFLRRWGIEELVADGRRVWSERAHLGDLDAIRGRSRVLEADALCDPSGLGAFLALEWHTP